MSPKRIKQRMTDFEKALVRLNDALQEDPAQASAIIDGTIQRFEFIFELAWKLGRDYLGYQGIEANNPRAVIKEIFQQGIIQQGDEWIQMLDDRNKTTHIYDEHEAVAVYQRIKKQYACLLSDFHRDVSGLIVQIKE